MEELRYSETGLFNKHISTMIEFINSGNDISHKQAVLDKLTTLEIKQKKMDWYSKTDPKQAAITPPK
jgi:hypothetical protein